MSLMTSDKQAAYFGIGRRKTSVAKVILVSGSGSMVVNHKPGELYLQFNSQYINAAKAPLIKLGLENTYDIYVIKINDSGDILWDATFGSKENDLGMGIIETLDNGFAIIGSTNNFGNGNKNSSDVWLIKANSNGFTTNFVF